jgi:dihydrofolate synthase / folylpolyglutamate synthase
LKAEIKTMSFAEAVSYLLSLGHETLTIKLGLQNTETLLNALGNPHKQFPSVQIAGTNGKGSTAVMLESVCRAAGIRAGLFTSPHLISITERIRIAGQEISEAGFAEHTQRVKTVAAQLVKDGRLQALPTFFEQVTAIALLAFREAGIDLAILETGLGGRLDSTTAVGAEIVGITPIAMDHEEYLGNSLAEIASEKAAIIRDGVTAIVAPQASEALEVILHRCQSVRVTPRITQDRLPVPFENISIGLKGRHQIVNAAMVIALSQALREHHFQILDKAIVEGIASAKHAGRLELWEGQPQILFDGAHNPAAARALRDYLDESVKVPITMIFAAMRDKDLTEMAAILFPKAKALVLTSVDNPRAATVEMLTSVLPQGFEKVRLRRTASPKDAVRLARENTPADGLICVTGSLYLVGAVKSLLRKPDPH